MTEGRADDIARYSFLVAFANNHTIDPGELDFIKRLALEDQTIDDKERDVLRTIFAKVTRDEVADVVWEEIQAFRSQHGI